MGIIYSQPTLTSYNATPPPDDDSTTSANAVSWAKHISKIGDPLKTYAQAINTALVTAFGKIFNNNVSTVSTTYALQASDRGKLLVASGAITINLLSCGTAGSGFTFSVRNGDSSNSVTLDGETSETINGATTLVIPPSGSAIFVTDGSSWTAVTTGLLSIAAGTVDKYLRSDGTDPVWSYPPFLMGNVLAPHKNLICKQVTVATVDIDADNILLLDSAGGAFNAASVNLTLNIATSGALGLDTGVEANSTWYHLWVLAKRDGTITGVLSLATALASVTLPTDYVYGGLVGAVYNDSGGAFDYFYQRGVYVNAEDKVALSAGAATTYTLVSLAAIVPSTAVRVGGYIGSSDTGSSAGQITVAPSNAADDHGMVRSSSRSGTTGNEISPFELMLETAQTIYYLVGTSDNGDINITK